MPPAFLAEPIHVGGFRGQRFVLTADDVPEPFDGIGLIHSPAILVEGMGQKLPKGRFQYTIHQSLNLGPGR